MERAFRNNSIKKVVFLSLLLSIALTIFIIESQIPPIVPIQGVKLGLANIITLIVIIFWGLKEATIIVLLRVILGSIFTGQVVSLLYSLSGGLLAVVIMGIIYKLISIKSIEIISICGAIAHNIRQIIVAMILINNKAILIYLPILMVSSIITGYFIGKIVKYTYKKLIKSPLFNEECIFR